LIDAGFIIKVNNLNAITNSLSFEEDDSCYKIYLHDFGLLMPMIDEASRFEIYNGSLDTYKGGIYESVVASQLIHKYTKLYYYSPNENIENEFVFPREDKIYLLEVKAGKNTKSISFDKMLNEYQLIGIKISSKNIGYNERFLTIPHYMIFLL
jgi:predicted AAA+ superfamily ATPase